VQIDNLDLIEATNDTARLSCICGKGTYVRSIARDLAEILGTKGYISALRRTRVGCFNETTAITLDKLRETALQHPPQAFVLPVGQALDDIPALTLTQPEAVRIKSGNAIDLVSRLDVERLTNAGLDPRLTNDTLALAHDHGGQVLALLSVTGPRISPVRVFNF
jgi:tRNA pseudouridine55 synthase